MKTVAIIGAGYVGKAMIEMLRDHYTVLAKDIDKEILIDEETIREYPAKSTDYSMVNKANLAIICVPTPMEQGKKEFKDCDTSIVERTVKLLKVPVILIKSTVSPGTTDRLKKKYRKRIVFSPEYAGESSYWSPYTFDKNMKDCPFVILGGDKKDTNYVLDFFVPILGPKKFYYQVTAKEAEVIKYMENTYFGVKVIFANEMKAICDALEVDYYAVRTGWALDPRVDEMHTMVFPNARGFGGKCLPKDINGIVAASQRAGYEPELLKQVLRSNKKMRNEN